MTGQLQRKIDTAVKFLQTYAKGCNGSTIELAYSGGKDSDVILALARMAGIDFVPIYKCTTIDPPGTIKHVMDNGVQIVRPKKTFFQLIEKRGFPMFNRRFCCDVLKEYKIYDHCILGIRAYESEKRKKRYTEPTECRKYSKTESVEQVYPILFWTNNDIAEFITHYKIQLAPHYYRTDGSIDFSRRLGCMGCPLKSDNGKADFIARPKLVRAWLRAGKQFLDTHPNSQSEWDSVYELFAFCVFFVRSNSEFPKNGSGVLFQTDWKAELENYFKIDLTL